MAVDFFGLPRAQLLWSETGEPQDKISQDVYFSSADGIQETKTVFLNGCGLPKRWNEQPLHTIAELGFGTGLNFLASIALWRKTCQPGQKLHYISVEGSPLSAEEMARAHLRFTELTDEATELRAVLPPAIKGFHHCHIGTDIQISLLYGPVGEMLPQLQANVDSWFLDGFSPAKNPQMWSTQVFDEIYRLSAPEAHLASFSVAGSVCRGLNHVGFEIEKKPGHGYKRHRLEAVLTRKQPSPDPTVTPKTVMVIGGGIAGACLVHQLARHGMDCLLIDSSGLASGASGNPIGLVSPRLDLDDTPLARFYRTAFCYAIQFYQQNASSSFKQTGISRMAQSPEQWDKFAKLFLYKALPDDMLALNAEKQELQLSTAGTLQPVKAIQTLVANADIVAKHVTKLANESGQWVARDENDKVIARTDIVVLAHGVGEIAGLGLPVLRKLRGQISIAGNITDRPKTPIIGKSYALSVGSEELLFGATHDRVDEVTDTSVKPSDHRRNLAELEALLPELVNQIDASTLTGRTSYRAASPDLQPLAGQVPDFDKCKAWAKQYWGKLDDYSSAPVQSGLYMLNGLGSRGLTLAPILAKAIVADILGHSSPLEKEAATALHPARFAARTARREADK
ncbi:MAG: FAD-dependent 5-carboxymethylaminomethyl-2-thiouridine(34) oxidoreductase MnmC [Robiginitomaculum sp.]|nr:FAD-dependent 5-carboxymethylaminomethyl-2-thiouridine(34) oxidoreductase MnmC [Robiginitomaculum sp.]